jgi:hypothetical protein
MPAVSQAQQALMGQAYAIKTGKMKPADLNPEYRDQIVDLAKSMKEEDLKDFAETPKKKLPTTVKENYTMKNLKTFEAFVNESVNEKAMDTKYWSDYNLDGSGQSTEHFAEKSTDFEDTFSLAVSEWNAEAEGAENRIKGAQIKTIKKLAQEFFKIEKWISVNVIQAMIMQES